MRMNVRLSGQKIRLRINKAELTLLLAGESILTKTIFLDGSSLSFYLNAPHQNTPALLGRDGDIIRFVVGRELLADLANKAPSKEGITFLLGETEQTPLRITIELDVFT